MSKILMLKDCQHRLVSGLLVTHTVRGNPLCITTCVPRSLLQLIRHGICTNVSFPALISEGRKRMMLVEDNKECGYIHNLGYALGT